MNNQPTVSVVMITYQHQDYIQKAIEGVFIQKTNFSVEFIISNDFSTDATDAKIKQCLPKAPEHISVDYKLQPENLGMKENFISALLSISGKYIAICEGDDYWTDALKLQKQVDFMEQHTEVDFLFHACQRLMPNGKIEPYPTNKMFRKTGLIDKEMFLTKGGGSFATPSLMLRTEMLKDRSLDELYPLVNLDLLIAILAIKNGEVAYINEVMAMYRVDAKGSWSSKINIDNQIERNRSSFKAVNLFNEITERKFEKYITSLKNSLCLHQHYFHIIKHKTVHKNLWSDIKHIGVYNYIRLLFKLMDVKLRK